MKFVYVALGGAFGAMARYAISLLPVKSDFPILTLVTNILGAILIGFIVGIAEAKNGVSDEAMLFLKTGVCGGFTTFSTFSLEAANMFDEKRVFAGGLYMVLSCTCCVIGVIVGRKISKAF